MSKPTTTRRGFLGAVAAAVGLVAAGPAVAAAETLAPAPAAPPAAPFFLSLGKCVPMTAEEYARWQSGYVTRSEFETTYLGNIGMTPPDRMTTNLPVAPSDDALERLKSGHYSYLNDGAPSSDGPDAAYNVGWEDGYTEGHAEGFRAGKLAGQAKTDEAVADARAEAINRGYLVGRSGAEERAADLLTWVNGLEQACRYLGCELIASIGVPEQRVFMRHGKEMCLFKADARVEMDLWWHAVHREVVAVEFRGDGSPQGCREFVEDFADPADLDERGHFNPGVDAAPSFNRMAAKLGISLQVDEAIRQVRIDRTGCSREGQTELMAEVARQMSRLRTDQGSLPVYTG